MLNPRGDCTRHVASLSYLLFSGLFSMGWTFALLALASLWSASAAYQLGDVDQVVERIKRQSKNFLFNFCRTHVFHFLSTHTNEKE